MGWRWQNDALTLGMDDIHPMRRVHGIHEIRFDGLTDLLIRAHGCSVFDVGCNRGHVGWDFAVNGASVVHGCDIDRPSIQCARMWFSEHPHISSKFEVVDLSRGYGAIADAFGGQRYDIVLLLGVHHKLKKVMQKENLGALVKYLGDLSGVYFAWNGYQEDLIHVDSWLPKALRRIHVSELSKTGNPSAIWKRI